jgi:hypothetical protein
MTVVEEIKLHAQRLAEARGISEAAGYEIVLRNNPSLYREVMAERANAVPAGSSESFIYAREGLPPGFTPRLGTPHAAREAPQHLGQPQGRMARC